MSKYYPARQQGHFTAVNNGWFDVVFQTLSPGALRVLLHIIRKTIGWHVEQDAISYSQLMDGTGIASKATVSRALKELEAQGIIQVTKTGKQRSAYLYQLNRDFSISTESVSVNSTETVPPISTESVHTKEREKKKKTNKSYQPAADVTPEPAALPKEPAGVVVYGTPPPKITTAKSEPQPKAKKPKTKTDHQQVMAMYQEALGYTIPNGAREGKAASWMLKQDYTPEQIIGCYEWMKLEPFWQNKPISLQSVKGQIGEWLTNGRGSGAKSIDMDELWKAVLFRVDRGETKLITDMAALAAVKKLGTWEIKRMQSREEPKYKERFMEAYRNASANQK